MRIILLAFVILSSVAPVRADLDSDVRKELTGFNRELRTVSGLIRKKKIEEAEAIIQKVESRLDELQIADDERDRTFRSVKSALQRAKAALPVSFEKDVAPIINDNCVRCHGPGRASANLRLDTYANMGKVMPNKPPLLIPRNPNRSLILARLTVEGDARMPKGGDRLSGDDIQTLANWIAQGARFDGEDVNAKNGASLIEKKEPVKVVMADGSETVSFKKDIAPWMVNMCGGCHGGNNPRGDYALRTFEDVLTDGPTGSTVVPGDPDSSYMVDLVLRQQPQKMPQGNANLKRSQAVALEKWIREGAKFDGTDPKATLRSLVPTEEELATQALLSMSDGDFRKRRQDQAKDLWKRVAPREKATSFDTENLFVYGNLPESRMEEFGNIGEQHVQKLLSDYKIATDTPWRGRLIVFVTKTRFDYEEFNTVLQNRRTPRGISGHSFITPNVANAYVVMHDSGKSSDDSLEGTDLLKALISRAFLQREGSTLPDWLVHGFGILSADVNDTKYVKQIPNIAAGAVKSINNPATIFDNGTFPPDEVGPVGMLLTRFLLRNGGQRKLAALVNQLKTEQRIGRAIQAVYKQDARKIAEAFLRSGG